MTNKSSKKQGSNGQNRNQIFNMQKHLTRLEKRDNPNYYKRSSKNSGDKI